MSAQFDRLLPALVHGGVGFILVGGVAGIVHGAARLTYDLDGSMTDQLLTLSAWSRF